MRPKARRTAALSRKPASCSRATSARRSWRLRGTSGPMSSREGTARLGGGFHVLAALDTAAASLVRSSLLAAMGA